METTENTKKIITEISDYITFLIGFIYSDRQLIYFIPNLT